MYGKVPHRFSLVEPVIEKLYLENYRFREIYQDYLECLEALEYWKISHSDEAPVIRSEYEDLVKEIENEIIDKFLNSQNLRSIF